MKERPILFSGNMVRAILDGRKTQTRRVVKDPERLPTDPENYQCTGYGLVRADEFGRAAFPIRHPYGAAGDRLWVRETWKPDCNEEYSGIAYRADNAFIPIDNTAKAADRWIEARKPEEQYPELKPPVWRPSIFMPRWASRIALDVTGVRIERLQHISREDAICEGIEQADFPGTQSYIDYLVPGTAVCDPRKSFGSL